MFSLVISMNFLSMHDVGSVMTSSVSFTCIPLSFPKTKFGKQGLYHKSLINWCAIPEEIRNIDIFPIFCNKLLQLCHENQKKYLCTDLCNVCDYSCIENVAIVHFRVKKVAPCYLAIPDKWSIYTK